MMRVVINKASPLSSIQPSAGFSSRIQPPVGSSSSCYIQLLLGAGFSSFHAGKEESAEDDFDLYHDYETTCSRYLYCALLINIISYKARWKTPVSRRYCNSSIHNVFTNFKCVLMFLSKIECNILLI